MKNLILVHCNDLSLGKKAAEALAEEFGYKAYDLRDTVNTMLHAVGIYGPTETPKVTESQERLRYPSADKVDEQLLQFLNSQSNLGHQRGHFRPTCLYHRLRPLVLRGRQVIIHSVTSEEEAFFDTLPAKEQATALKIVIDVQHDPILFPVATNGIREVRFANITPNFNFEDRELLLSEIDRALDGRPLLEARTSITLSPPTA